MVDLANKGVYSDIVNDLANAQIIPEEKREAALPTKEFLGILNSIDMKKIIGTIKEESICSREEFLEKQHDILDGYYIVVYLEGPYLRIITENKNCYLIHLKTIPYEVYNVIFRSYMPRKICINMKEFYYKFNEEGQLSSMYDISLISKVFFAKKVSDLNGIIELFFKNYEECSLNELLYGLHLLKESINILLERYNLMKLLNNEMQVQQIIYDCEKEGLPINEKKYYLITKEIREIFSDVQKSLQKKYKGESFNCAIEDFEKTNLFKDLKNNNLYLSVNENYLKNTSSIELAELVKCHKLYEMYHNQEIIITEGRAYIQYDNYNQYGNISYNTSFFEDIYAASEGTYLTTGEYVDLYWRLFAQICKIDFVIEGVTQNNFLEKLTERIFEDVTPALLLETESVLMTLISNQQTITDMQNYIFKNYDTYLNVSKIKEVLNKFENKCFDLVDVIMTFNKTKTKNLRSFSKRWPQTEEKSLNVYIKLLETDVFKTMLVILHKKLLSFNKINKNKIKFVGIGQNKVFLESSAESKNVAIDLLNSGMEKGYNKFITRVPIKYLVRSNTAKNKKQNQ